MLDVCVASAAVSCVVLHIGFQLTGKGKTPSPADLASRGGTLGGGKMGLRYGTFFANLTKVPAKICVLLQKCIFLLDFHLDFCTFAKIC